MVRLLRIFSLFRISSAVSKEIIPINYVGINSNIKRYKYNQNIGVKGIKSKKPSAQTQLNLDGDESEADLNIVDSEYDMIAGDVMHVKRKLQQTENVFVIQPYVKWGPKKTTTSPDLQLQEAIALVKSLPEWNVQHSAKIPLESLEKRTLFGKGKLEELKETINQMSSHGKPVSSIFISKGTLSYAQKLFLETEFRVPVMDRYTIVIQILRLHATSTEAKLQVAMAEIPYIWTQMKDATTSNNCRQGYALSDTQKELLRSREKKLKNELENIRAHRKLLRNKRKQRDYPIVAIVGYTNSGKTSLIKALTDEQKIEPKDQLFATLDVTAHSGQLPCNLEVIYMDTVGFLTDIPTGLIECFVATLEDAMLADIIIHVQDLSHKNHIEQKRHVENTLRSLMVNEDLGEQFTSEKIINVGNKIDLLSEDVETGDDLQLISAKNLSGVDDLLLEIESKVLKATNRKKITFRVANGGEEMAWLYKNATVVGASADKNDPEFILVEVIITNSKFQQFEHVFVGNKIR